MMWHELELNDPFIYGNQSHMDYIALLSGKSGKNIDAYKGLKLQIPNRVAEELKLNSKEEIRKARAEGRFADVTGFQLITLGQMKIEGVK